VEQELKVGGEKRGKKSVRALIGVEKIETDGKAGGKTSDLSQTGKC